MHQCLRNAMEIFRPLAKTDFPVYDVYRIGFLDLFVDSYEMPYDLADHAIDVLLSMMFQIHFGDLIFTDEQYAAIFEDPKFRKIAIFLELHAREEDLWERVYNTPVEKKEKRESLKKRARRIGRYLRNKGWDKLESGPVVTC